MTKILRIPSLIAVLSIVLFFSPHSLVHAQSCDPGRGDSDCWGNYANANSNPNICGSGTCSDSGTCTYPSSGDSACSTHNYSNGTFSLFLEAGSNYTLNKDNHDVVNIQAYVFFANKFYPNTSTSARLSFTGCPSGATCTGQYSDSNGNSTGDFTFTNFTSTNSAVTITTNSSTIPGTYPMTLKLTSGSSGVPCSSSCSETVNFTVTITGTPPVMSGTLTPVNPTCVISLGASSCSQTLNWTTTNPVATSAVTSPTGTPSPANGNSGSQSFTAPYNPSGVNFFLYNNAVLLAQTNVTTACISGSAWNGTMCTAGGTMTGTLAPHSATSCVIASGQSSCNINYDWHVTNPVVVGGSAVTKAPNVTVGTGDNVTNSPLAVKWGGDTFYLYNNAVLLAQSTVIASSITCASGTSWNGTTCASNVCNDPAANNVGYPLPCTYGCLNGATNPPTCTLNGGGGCVNGATNPPTCTIGGGGGCLNGATNPPACTTGGASGNATIISDKTTIVEGDSVILTWNGGGACAGTNFNTGGSPSGSVTVTPTSTTTYTVTCPGGGLLGPGSASIKVTVKKKPTFIEN